MPGTNLTRVEAEERSGNIRAQSYKVKLELGVGPDTFRTETTVRFSARANSESFIDAITASVHEITLNGESLDPTTHSDGVRIRLPRLAAENTLHIVADARYTNTGEGLHRFVDPIDDEVYLYTQFEVPDSRRMYAVFEQPDMKATFQFLVSAPSSWRVVSNMETPTPRELPDGRSEWTFAPTPTISSYITAIVAGPYRSWHGELTSSDGRTIPLGVFARASLAEHVDHEYLLDITRAGFKFYEAKFGRPYPFTKYDQLFVPEFNAGAMENAGAVTFTDSYVFRSKVSDAVRERRVVTVLHELAHMWFGDLVTMKWWNDLWLNESFAEWASTLATAEATEWVDAWTTFNSMEKAWAVRQDQLPTTHPIVATINDLEDVLVNFDGITYAKGASVLKQLVAWVGRDSFFAGVHEYFKKHEWGNARLADLLAQLSVASGRELESWSKSWLETAGVNTLVPVVESGPDGKIARFAVKQSAMPDYPVLRPHRLAIGLYSGNHAVRRIRRVEIDIDGAVTEVPELSGLETPDLIALNDDDLTYAKIRLDDRSRQFAIDHLCEFEDGLARALLWGSFWDATRDAEIPAREYLTLVHRHLRTEDQPTTIRTVLSNAVIAAASYTDPEHRTATLREVADLFFDLAIAATPGADNQFQFLRAFASVAEYGAHGDDLSALFSGSLKLPGLEIDTDLGWDLLVAKVSAGLADETDVAAYLQTDPSSTGHEAAARARAALPTPDGKARAWESIVTKDGASNTIVRATAEGFQRAADRTLLEPYVSRYFDSLERVWRGRSYAIAEKIAVGFYPAPLASKALAEASARWLESHPEPVALSRLVRESLAGVTRALAAQQCDRSARRQN